MKFISKITDALRLAEAHTVVIVKQAVRLPGIALEAGVHHLDYDVRLLLKKAKDVRAASLIEIHTLAGDTEAVLVTLRDRAEELVGDLSHSVSMMYTAVETAKAEVMTLTAKLEHAMAKGAEAVEAEAIHGGAILIQQASNAVDAAKNRLASLEATAAEFLKLLGDAEAKLEIAEARVTKVEPDAEALAKIEAEEAAAAALAAADAAVAAAHEAELAEAKKVADAAVEAAHVATLVEPVVILDGPVPAEVPATVVAADVAPAAGAVENDADPMHQA